MKGADTGVFPTKGKGWGAQGEAAFPDLIQRWNQTGHWWSWRRGMALAFSPDAPLVDGLQVLAATGLAGAGLAGPGGEASPITANPALKVDFPSRGSPQGAWSVVIRPRGVMTGLDAVSDADQSEVTWELPQGPLRVLQVRAPWVITNAGLAPSLIGELIEDTVDADGKLLDVRDGHGLLCVGADVLGGSLLFDATRLWRYESAGGSPPGRILHQIAIPRTAAAPRFRSGRRLTQSMAVACNCPSYLGAVSESLERGVRLGTQGVFPQALSQPFDVMSPGQEGETSAGIKRRFAQALMTRIPGIECKHCAAVRFLLRSPVSEPKDNPVIWPGDPDLYLAEEFWKLDYDKKLAEELEAALSVRERWEGIDMTLLAQSAGDAFTVMPSRVIYEQSQPVRDDLENFFLRRMSAEQQLFPEQVFSVAPELAVAPRLGDWWVGRGTSPVVLIYGPDGKVLDTPAITRLGPSSVTEDLLAGLP